MRHLQGQFSRFSPGGEWRLGIRRVWLNCWVSGESGANVALDAIRSAQNITWIPEPNNSPCEGNAWDVSGVFGSRVGASI